MYATGDSQNVIAIRVSSFVDIATPLAALTHRGCDVSRVEHPPQRGLDLTGLQHIIEGIDQLLAGHGPSLLESGEDEVTNGLNHVGSPVV